MNVPGNARFGTFCEPSSENSDSALCRFDRANRSARAACLRRMHFLLFERCRTFIPAKFIKGKIYPQVGVLWTD